MKTKHKTFKVGDRVRLVSLQTMLRATKRKIKLHRLDYSGVGRVIKNGDCVTVKFPNCVHPVLCNPQDLTSAIVR